DRVVERELVVARDEVDRLLGLAVEPGVDVGARQKAFRDGPDLAGIALDERPNVVAEAAVPLDPAIAGERTHLVQAGRVPGLRDQLRAGQDRVGLDVPDDRWPRDRPAVL